MNIYRKIIFGIIFVFWLSSLSYAGFLPRSTPDGQPVYRFWSDVFNHQFLTIDKPERDHVIANDANWRYDGIAYYAYKDHQSGTVPLYRFWSDVFKGHFFTINEDEKTLTEQNPDWTYEGIAYYVYPEGETAPINTSAVYRLWSDSNHSGGHFYTTFGPERDSLAASGNYQYEFSAFRAFQNPAMNKMVGMMMHPFQYSWSHRPPYEDYKNGIQSFNTQIGKNHRIVMFFAGWENAEGMYGFGKAFPRPGDKYQAGWLANQINQAGAVPMITWEPWRGGAGIFQSNYTLDQITNGAHDEYIIGFARDIKNWGRPILIRWGHEMNGNYYPWSCSINNNDPGKYVQAFRHVREIFQNVGASNAYFVWSPNYASPTGVTAPCNDLSKLYPGDAYVDFIGVSVYNWGNDTTRGPGWTDLENLTDEFLIQMAKSHPDKEVIICETGCAHDRDANEISQWISNAYKYLATKGIVSAIVYFDDYAFHSSSSTDFRVTQGHDWPSSPVDSMITDAYKSSVANYGE